ncbi:MAG: threonylcarbamoyl-AMP synthase [Nitrospirae bacterium]|nr:threonylcarbamoyl-AMP synthase [Nitrospirota bacterium]
MKKISLQKTAYKEALDETSKTILSGGIACFPTETFYGLGARYDDPEALAKIYEIKGRPHHKGMPLIIGDMDSLSVIAGRVEDSLLKLAGVFWPGPLTLLLPAREGLPDFITAGSGRVAVRVPGRSFALDLAKQIGVPITATSANISGMPPAESAGDAEKYFDAAPDLLVDGGKCAGGRPSTIIELIKGTIRIVRQGAVSEEEIRRKAASVFYELK